MIRPLIQIAEQAGHLVMEVYHQGDFEIRVKEDQSPLTEADMASHLWIQKCLKQLNPDIPLLSEEEEVEYATRKHWDEFWCVDPLDGTKDFIAKNDQFAINLALIRKGRPVLGVIHIPALKETYWAEQGQGAFRGDQPIRNDRSTTDQLVAAKSNFHNSQRVEDFLRLNRVTSSLGIGSSIKFCRFAEGKIDLYPRLGPTCEWDTAAGQIIVEESGGCVMDLNTRAPLVYNKENLVNPQFILSRKDLLSRWIFEGERIFQHTGPADDH